MAAADGPDRGLGGGHLGQRVRRKINPPQRFDPGKFWQSRVKVERGLAPQVPSDSRFGAGYALLSDEEAALSELASDAEVADFCARCRDGWELLVCSFCPSGYHLRW